MERKELKEREMKKKIRQVSTEGKGGKGKWKCMNAVLKLN